MKAAVYRKYGPPSVTKIEEIDQPIPSENEVLIKVHTSTINRTDAGFRSAEYFVSRFWSGLFRPKLKVLGSEFSGTIVGLGNNCKNFKIGDKVFGFSDKTFGGHAEYMVINENAAIETIPSNYSLETAACLTEGSHYALVDIRAAKVQKGHEVLVNGGTGAIGSAAIQLLKHFGAKVTAVCATPHLETVKNLGADKVIDYLTEDFTKSNQKYDFIFDAVGKSSYRKCKALLNPKGIYISTELGKNGVNIPLALLTPLFGGRKLLFPIPSISREDVTFIKNLADIGEFKPLIDRTYLLDEIVEGYTYVATGKKIGNVLLKIEQ